MLSCSPSSGEDGGPDAGADTSPGDTNTSDDDGVFDANSLNPYPDMKPDADDSRPDADDDASSTGTLASECDDADPAWIWCDDFESDRLESYFEYDDNDGDFVPRDGVGVDGSRAMSATFQTGEVGAGSLHLAFGNTPSNYFAPVDDGTENYREVYWRMYLRHQDGWTGGGGAKLSRATVFAGDDWSQAMIGHVWSGGDQDHYLVLDPASGTDEAGSVQTTQYNDFDNLRWLGIQRGETPLFDADHVGEWYCIEAHVRLNDAGQSNGVFEYWIDGNLEARAADLNWVGSYSEYGLNAVYFENYWNDGSTQEQSRFFDNLVVSTERIGCGS